MTRIPIFCTASMKINTVGIRKTSIKERLNRLLLRGNNGEHRANLRSNTASVLLEYYPDIDEEYRAAFGEVRILPKEHEIQTGAPKG